MSLCAINSTSDPLDQQDGLTETKTLQWETPTSQKSHVFLEVYPVSEDLLTSPDTHEKFHRNPVP